MQTALMADRFVAVLLVKTNVIKKATPFELPCDPAGTRTLDLLIKSQ